MNNVHKIGSKPLFWRKKAPFLSKNGIVLDKKVRKNVCEKIIGFAQNEGFGAIGFDYAPIREGKNVEFLLHLKKNAPSNLKQSTIEVVCNK